MPTAKLRLPIKQQNLMYDHQQMEFDDRIAAASFSDIVFGFPEEGKSSPPSNWEIEEDGDGENANCGQDDKSFWEEQHQILRGTLFRTSSLETSIRRIVKETIKEVHMAGGICNCGKPIDGSCRNCLMREVSGRIRNAGYNSAICKSKWRTSLDIPSGEHTFLDVIDNTKRGETRIIIELNFQAEFEMAKASKEYNRLVTELPEVFVGKVERLQGVIKILCTAAKKCMKEKKMHMGPWRKQRYMQAKWLSTTYERTTVSVNTPVLATENSGRLRKPRASMLTVDLLDSLPNVHCTAVAVV